MKRNRYTVIECSFARSQQQHYNALIACMQYKVASIVKLFQKLYTSTLQCTYLL